MNQLYTERERRFVDLAAQLADEFAPRAAAHDISGEFPHENYARMKESGYTLMTIPEELGGQGASLLERIKAQERLARGCGATALAVNMHFNVSDLLIDLWTRFRDPKVGDKLRRIAAERLICGGTNSEPDNAAIFRQPRTTARRVAGGYEINGRKIFATQSIAMDLYYMEATWREAPQGPTIISFYVPVRETPGIVFKDDWNTMGMRATASRGVDIQQAFVPDSAVVMERPVGSTILASRAFVTNPFAIGAPYIGIALAARDFTVDFMRDRPRYPLKHPMSHLPAVYNKVGEMDILIEGARAVMWKAAAELEFEPPTEWVRKAVAAKYIAVENSMRVVDLAMRAVGGASYYKRFPLERWFRDVRAGVYHPFDSDEGLEFVGKSAFGISMIEDMETGED
jgi:alkylation response protein AidB-like acyl-CoA dehydrogenase